MLKDFGRTKLRPPVPTGDSRITAESARRRRRPFAKPANTGCSWAACRRAAAGRPGDDAAKLRVEQRTGPAGRRDDRRILFNFGGEEVHAWQALAVVRKSSFTHVGVVNPAAPAMMGVFRRAGASAALAPAIPARALEPAAPTTPAVDPTSPAGRLLAKHPEVVGGPIVAPAIPPLRQAAVSTRYTIRTSLKFPTPRLLLPPGAVLRQDHGSWKLARRQLPSCRLWRGRARRPPWPSAMQQLPLYRAVSGARRRTGFGTRWPPGRRRAARCSAWTAAVPAGPPGGASGRGPLGRCGAVMEPSFRMGGRKGRCRAGAGGDPQNLGRDRLRRLGTADGKGLTFLGVETKTSRILCLFNRRTSGRPLSPWLRPGWICVVPRDSDRPGCARHPEVPQK